jgi:cytochrome P450
MGSGPIIRINPREVHIQDPDYYEEIYASSIRNREKDPVLVAQFGLDGSGFASVDAESHRQRRAPVERFFSKRAVQNMEGLIYKATDKLVFYIDKARHSHSVVNLDAGFAALTSDVINEYVYGSNPGNLDKEGFNAHVRDGINGLFRMAHLIYFFPVLQTVMDMVPLGILEKVNPPAFALATQKRDLYLRGAEALKQADAGKSQAGENLVSALAATTMPGHMRLPERLMNEGFALVIGGTETTARTLAVGAWHIYNRDDIRRKLRDELKTVMPTPDSRPSWNDLEKLPYLVSSHGCVARSV